MTTIADLCRALESLAPLVLAEAWDNVGLLVGDRSGAAERVMTCLTVTAPVVAEAIQQSAQLIVTHHPLPFRPLQQLTCDSTAGRLLWDLMGRRIALYSAHTAFDSARGGINQQLGLQFGLERLAALRPVAEDPTLGSGRIGQLSQPTPLPEFCQRIRTCMGLHSLRGVPAASRSVHRIGIACGSGAEFLADAHRLGCDTFITGEASLHHCLEAQALGIHLLLLGHYASERFAMQRLAEQLCGLFPEIRCWASHSERDPIAPL